MASPSIHVRSYRQHRDYKAVDRAYADTGSRGDPNDRRQLNFHGSWTDDMELAKAQVRRIGYNNDFSPDNVVAFFDTLPDGTSFRVGREGSPVIYFSPSGMSVRQLYEHIEAYNHLLNYDELNIVEGVGEIRVWWD